MSCTYLLPPVEDVLDETHGAFAERRQVQLSLLREDVEDVKLALHHTCQLAPGHCDPSWLPLVYLIIHATDATRPSIVLISCMIRLSPMVG